MLSILGTNLSVMKSLKSILTVSCLFLCSFFFVVFIGNAQADSQWFENIGATWDEWGKTAEKGVKDPLIEWHYYWKDGFHVDSTKKDLKIRFNGRVLLDGGSIGADNELNRAFPDLEGGNIQFRDLRASMFGTLYDWMEFKFSMDFANVRDIKDEWIRFTKIPYIGLSHQTTLLNQQMTWALGVFLNTGSFSNAGK
ncbi:MAG: hypothetical protein JRJ15_12735 [Deltaproteobacteria bacterium]|nr:hypothetical protein [Deltaproteobacteria bacterium]